MSFANSIDVYSLQARLKPALLVILPLVVTTISFVPDLLQISKGLIGFAVACGVTVLLSHISRDFGRKAEARLLIEWDGMPTSHWLSHKGNKLDVQTLTRCHAFLENQINGWKAPSSRDEIENPKKAEVAYESAVRWLREKTRDREKFDMVFRENISYGFRRNLYGLKCIALVVIFICLAVNVSMLGHTVFYHSIMPEALIIVSLVLNLASLLFWTVVVRALWVRKAADNYARALIATCEQLSERH